MVGELVSQGLRCSACAVGNQQLGRAAGQQFHQRAACGATGAQHQYTGAFQGHAQIAFDVVGQAQAVEVVDDDAPTALELHGVGRAGNACPLVLLGGHLEGLQLERRGDIQAAAAAVAEGAHRSNETFGRTFDLAVLEVLPRALRKAGVDQRRLAMGDGAADDSVAVRHDTVW